MTSSPRFPLIILIVLIAFLSACVGSKNANGIANNRGTAVNSNSRTSDAHDDIEELEGAVNLAFHPDEAVWRDDPGPTEKSRKLIAVLKFTAADSAKVVEMISKTGPGEAFEIESESWFPPELIAKSQESGNATIKGKSYPATDFMRPPFNDGRISRIDDTDFYILELNIK